MLVNKDKYIFGVCKVGERGQIVIPKEARTVFEIKAGDSLILVGDKKKGMALLKAEEFTAVADNVLGGGENERHNQHSESL